MRSSCNRLPRILRKSTWGIKDARTIIRWIEAGRLHSAETLEGPLMATTGIAKSQAWHRFFRFFMNFERGKLMSRKVTQISFASIFLFASLLLIPAPAPAQEKLTTTTAKSDKFGKGGTLETTSDEKSRVVKEVWRDATGKNRETHLVNYDAKGVAR